MEHYLDLADRLKKKRSSRSPAAKIFIGNDQEQRLFKVGMHDRPEAGEDRSTYDDFPGAV